MSGSVNSVHFIDTVCNAIHVINKMTFCFNWRSLGRGGCLFRDILGNLRESAYLHQAKGHHNSLIALYHAGMANKDLEYILHEFSKPDSILRLIICTIAFGMGINIPDIEVVVHWGACDSMMDYWQEVGRAGRDGRASKAMYYVTPRSILQTSDTMKELCKALDQSNITCFRDAILKHFTGYSPAPVRSVCTLKCIECDCLYCKCCHLCRKACPCVKNSH